MSYVLLERHAKADRKQLGELQAQISQFISTNRAAAQRMRQVAKDFRNGKNKIGVPDLLQTLEEIAKEIDV